MSYLQGFRAVRPLLEATFEEDFQPGSYGTARTVSAPSSRTRRAWRLSLPCYPQTRVRRSNTH